MTTRIDEIGPPQAPGALQWLRENLFDGWWNTVLTLISLAVLYIVVVGSVRWVFFSADWTPVTSHLLLYLVGQYTRPELWRVGACLLLLSLLFGVSWGVWRDMMRTFAATLAAALLFLVVIPSPAASYNLTVRGVLLASVGLILLGFLIGRSGRIRPRPLMIAWTVSLLVSFLLLRGLGPVGLLPRVQINLWGGLIVTVILAVGGIGISFPIGVLLALGRRSELPVVSVFSTAFIELIRGVPLITILFMGSLIVPLFLPLGMRVDLLVRALVGMIIFSAAYVAENVRGGLQAIPNGQFEAAYAVGLNNFQTTLFIVLPQALRKVIPAIVGQFISLFKDTTLAAGIGVLELLQIGRSILQGTPEYIDNQFEVYVFIAVIFWVFSYSMSITSQRLETRLGVGET